MSIKELLNSGVVGAEVTVQGWVRTRRDSKGFSFLEINDGSTINSIQVVAEDSIPNYEANVLKADTGAAVKVSGSLVESPGKGQRVEIKAGNVELIGPVDSKDYPLQKKRHSFEFLRTIAHLRPRTNTYGAVFRVRNAASYAVHKFFQERGFIYLTSPIITGSDCEGAGEMFRVSTINPAAPPKRDGKIDFAQDFFGREAGLTVSGQLEAEIFAMAFKNVYTFGPTFRADNSNTSRHLAEFWMIEPEMAFCDLKGDMDLARDFTKSVINHVLENCAEDMEFFDKWIEKGVINSIRQVADSDFEHMTYTEAIDALKKSDKKFEFPVEWGKDLQSEHERYLTEEYVKRPLFITNYPRSIKPFYMRVDDDKTVSAMDLLVPRIGEIIGGSQREEREDVLRARIKELGLNEEDYWWYIDLRRYGTNPHAGFGLGFERLMMFLTGMQNIRDVIPFPRTPGNISF